MPLNACRTASERPSPSPAPRTGFPILIPLLALFLLVWWLPAPLALDGSAHYPVLHMALETPAIVVAFLVFGVTWNTYQRDRPGVVNLIGCAMLATGLIDFAHMASYKGMPAFVTPASPEKAINFWLAARGLVALMLLRVALPPRPGPALSSRYGCLALALAVTGLVYWLGLFQAQALPVTFVPGRGLTPFKVAAEWGIIGLLLAAVVILYRQGRRQTEYGADDLLTAMVVSILSELCFTLYRDVTDLFNLLGHLYKVVAYLYIYRAVFVVTVRMPHQRLSETQAILLREREELRQTLKSMETLANAAPALMWSSDAAGARTWFNQRWLDFTGRALPQELGAGWTEGLHPDDRERCLAGYAAAFAGRQPFSDEYRVRRQDGIYRWLLGQGVPRYDADGAFIGYIGSYLDITEEKRKEQVLRDSERHVRQLNEELEQRVAQRTAALERANAALRENETRLQAILDNSRVLIFLKDLEGRYILANPRCAELIGQPQAAIPGKTDAELFPPELAATLRANDLLVIASGASLAFEEVSPPVDGMPRTYISLKFPLRDAEGAIYAVGGISTDITERQAILEALAQAKEEAEQASRAKSMFLANMSHEIRTPMNGIMNMAELCLMDDPSERQRHYLVRIIDASESLLHIINDILDFSKIEADKLDMAVEPFNLATVLDRVASILAVRAEDKGLALAFRVAPGLGLTLEGDPWRLEQVLLNLMGNAIKFSRQGEVALSVDETARDAGTVSLHFKVRDQGIGIAPEAQAKLFQPFSQVDASMTRNYGGNGLGLAISKRLVELMHGRIWVESAPGQGSTFQFTARFALSSQAPEARHERYLKAVDSAALARLKGVDILVVEDAELNQEVMRELLAQAGFRVRVAANGEEALQAIAEQVPDGVLMDCQMPVLDGFEATRRLRADARYRDLPVIALTANAMSGDRERCLAAGMNDFVSKPVNFAQLLAVLSQWVQPLAARPALASNAADPSESLPALPGIDTALGLRLTGGRIAFYEKTLKKFRDNRAYGFQADFQGALQAGDWNVAARLAHTLKGAARTLGAARLGDLAERVEAAARQGQWGAVAEGLAALDAELGLVLAGLERWGDGAAPEQ